MQIYGNQASGKTALIVSFGRVVEVLLEKKHYNNNSNSNLSHFPDVTLHDKNYAQIFRRN